MNAKWRGSWQTVGFRQLQKGTLPWREQATLHLLPIEPSHLQASDLRTNFPRQKCVQTDNEVSFKTKFKANYFIQIPATHSLPSSLQKYSSSQVDLRPKAASLQGISPLYMKLHSTQRCGRVGEKTSCSKTILWERKFIQNL